jgi:hypothetical protein
MISQFKMIWAEAVVAQSRQVSGENDKQRKSESE